MSRPLVAPVREAPRGPPLELAVRPRRAGRFVRRLRAGGAALGAERDAAAAARDSEHERRQASKDGVGDGGLFGTGDCVVALGRLGHRSPRDELEAGRALEAQADDGGVLDVERLVCLLGHARQRDGDDAARPAVEAEHGVGELESVHKLELDLGRRVCFLDRSHHRHAVDRNAVQFSGGSLCGGDGVVSDVERAELAALHPRRLDRAELAKHLAQLVEAHGCRDVFQFQRRFLGSLEPDIFVVPLTHWRKLAASRPQASPSREGCRSSDRRRGAPHHGGPRRTRCAKIK
mmetsp:Transcript_596/g.2189  ORF Transcript_596/g.2189 Transcript_596/m.2189 type:complete len:290 (-) Transcript_596:21-890(-)